MRHDFRMKLVLYVFGRRAYNIAEKVGGFPFKRFFFSLLLSKSATIADYRLLENAM